MEPGADAVDLACSPASVLSRPDAGAAPERRRRRDLGRLRHRPGRPCPRDRQGGTRGRHLRRRPVGQRRSGSRSEFRSTSRCQGDSYLRTDWLGSPSETIHGGGCRLQSLSRGVRHRVADLLEVVECTAIDFEHITRDNEAVPSNNCNGGAGGDRSARSRRRYMAIGQGEASR